MGRGQLWDGEFGQKTEFFSRNATHLGRFGDPKLPTEGGLILKTLNARLSDLVSVQKSVKVLASSHFKVTVITWAGSAKFEYN